MKLDDHFKSLLGEISLNSTRESRIESAFETWKGLLENDEEIKPKFKTFYQQGSYASNTAIRPQNNKEFDVDAVLLLELEDDLEPKDALNWLASRMKLNKAYEDKIKVKDRCVRVDYAGDFHIDVVLAKPSSGEVILIPSKKEGEWVETNPAGFTKWCSGIQSSNQSKFTNVVKMIKYWRDKKVGKDTAPKSILLTTLIGMNMVGKNSNAESLVETLDEMVNNIDSIIQDDDTVFVENPSLANENLARDWDKDKLNIFKDKLTKLKNDARDALDEKDKQKSIEKWQQIFDKFPSELSEAAEMAKSIQAGAVYVSGSGVLNQSDGIKIPSHRFFGEE